MTKTEKSEREEDRKRIEESKEGGAIKQGSEEPRWASMRTWETKPSMLGHITNLGREKISISSRDHLNYDATGRTV